MTMHKELDMLREEVEALKKLERLREEERAAKERAAKESEAQKITEVEESVNEIVTSLKEGKNSVQELIDDIITNVKNDYKDLSPTTTIGLFALGVLFGHMLSKK